MTGNYRHSDDSHGLGPGVTGTHISIRLGGISTVSDYPGL